MATEDLDFANDDNLASVLPAINQVCHVTVPPVIPAVHWEASRVNKVRAAGIRTGTQEPGPPPPAGACVPVCRRPGKNVQRSLHDLAAAPQGLFVQGTDACGHEARQG